MRYEKVYFWSVNGIFSLIRCGFNTFGHLEKRTYIYNRIKGGLRLSFFVFISAGEAFKIPAFAKKYSTLTKKFLGSNFS